MMGMTLGQRIQQVADSFEVSLNEIARRTKIDRRQLGRIVSGETRNPRLDTLQKIAAAIGVTTDYLLLDVDFPHKADPRAVETLASRLLGIAELNRVTLEVAAERVVKAAREQAARDRARARAIAKNPRGRDNSATSQADDDSDA